MGESVFSLSWFTFFVSVCVSESERASASVVCVCLFVCVCVCVLSLGVCDSVVMGNRVCEYLSLPRIISCSRCFYKKIH